jgi:hypothetical protein
MNLTPLTDDQIIIGKAVDEPGPDDPQAPHHHKCYDPWAVLSSCSHWSS